MKTKIFVFIFTLSLLSCNQKKPNENFENQKKVEKGMTTDEVLEIMGPPDYIKELGYTESRGDSIFIYSYEPPFGFSGYIQVWFNHSDRRVRSIHDGL
ncbi:MAG: hypothetical protein WCY16_10495 [Weeksellaceae bacterium]